MRPGDCIPFLWEKEVRSLMLSPWTCMLFDQLEIVFLYDMSLGVWLRFTTFGITLMGLSRF